MKILYVSTLLILHCFLAVSQVNFSQLPRDLQLYPRNSNNQAEVIISGTVTKSGYTRIGTQVLKEGVLTGLISQTLVPENNNQAFTLRAVIKAERAEYTFRVFIYSDIDSMQVIERNRIVCGDVYIIHGQSNALALSELAESTADFNDKYARNVTYETYPSNIRWYPAKEPYTSVGGIGLALQRLILENHGIPTCVLNGAYGGATIDTLKARDPANHANPNTYYGSLLYRAQWAGVAKQVKAIIWKQGEAEAGEAKTKGLISGYIEKFATLHKQFREDYGSARIYVGQINILNVEGDSAATLRDFQRRTKSLFSNVEPVATVGSQGYDGIHYDSKGHKQIAFEQYRLVARDFYGSSDTLQINSPNVRKVFYNTRKDSITLVFDDQMKMIWPKDTTLYDFQAGIVRVRQQKDYFYLDEQAGLVNGGFNADNRIILSLKQTSTAKTIRYLPNYFINETQGPYDGPTLKNARGMRAFSFANVPIAEAIPAVTTLSAKFVAKKQIQLTWTSPEANTSLVLERADSLPNTFRRIAEVNSSSTNYMDSNLSDSINTYYYRLRVYSSVSESAYSNLAKSQQLVLAIEPIELVVQLYPNPLTADRLLNIYTEQTTFTQISLYDLFGRSVKSWHGAAKNRLSMPLNDLPVGIYVAELYTSNGYTLRRKLFIR